MAAIYEEKHTADPVTDISISHLTGLFTVLNYKMKIIVVYFIGNYENNSAVLNRVTPF